jgi:hypothetical protein
MNDHFYFINFEAEKTGRKSVFRKNLNIYLMEVQEFMNWHWRYRKIRNSRFIRCGFSWIRIRI